MVKLDATIEVTILDFMTFKLWKLLKVELKIFIKVEKITSLIILQNNIFSLVIVEGGEF
jgi:hypothetical protein